MGNLMRYIAAVLLGLLGLGTFPFSTRALSNPGGQLLAGIAVALMFFAYRLWPSRRVTSEVAEGRAPMSPPPSRSSPARPIERVEGEGPRASGIPLTPNMPDLKQAEPVSSFMVGRWYVLFHDRPPTIAEGRGIDIPLCYLLTGTVFDPEAKKTRAIYTLETGFTDEVYFCMFDEVGKRSNLGDGTLLKQLAVFEAAVLERACAAAGLSPSAARRMNP